MRQLDKVSSLQPSPRVLYALFPTGRPVLLGSLFNRKELMRTHELRIDHVYRVSKGRKINQVLDVGVRISTAIAELDGGYLLVCGVD